MSYQMVTGSLMANSHPGSYCGQDAYNDMFVTEKMNELRFASIRDLQRIRSGIIPKDAGLQGCHRPHTEGGVLKRWLW